MLRNSFFRVFIGVLLGFLILGLVLTTNMFENYKNYIAEAYFIFFVLFLVDGFLNNIFTGNKENYKIKQIKYKNGETIYQPWGKLKYKPWKWEPLTDHTDCIYNFKTEIEAKECIKQEINFINSKKIVSEKFIKTNN